MAETLQTVLTIARGYMNDDNATQFNDPVLIPKAQEAHRELQEELWMIGSPIVRAQSGPIAYASGTTELTGLPNDLLAPMVLFENSSGSTAASAGWQPMTEIFYIPLGTAQGTTLSWWSWQQEKIILLGASANRAVIMQYRRKIPIPNVLTDPIGILSAESYLGARTAAIAVGTLGNADAMGALTTIAQANLAKIISSNRGQQKPLVKP